MGSPRVPFPSIAFGQNICCVAWWAEVLSSWHFPNLNRSPCRDVTLPETLLWGTFPFRQNIFHEARQAVSGERRCLLVVIFPSGKTPSTRHGRLGAVGGSAFLVVIFPSGKTSATGAPPVSACEAGGRCRCAQFGNIRLIGMLLECLEGLPVWRVFCWKPLSSSVISPCGKYAHGTAPKQAYRMEKSEN